MTSKEQIMKYLLEDAFASLILRASVVGGGGATDYESNIDVLKDKALSSVFWIDLGKVNEVVGSTY